LGTEHITEDRFVVADSFAEDRVYWFYWGLWS